MPRQLRFDPYALDLRDERLMRDGVPVDLTQAVSAEGIGACAAPSRRFR